MTARSAIVRLRRVLLFALVGLTAAIGSLYLLGRQGREPAGEEMIPAAPPARRDGIVASSDAFDYTQTLEGEPVFSIHGDSFSSGRDARVELLGVRIEIYRGGRKYAVASREATYDPNTREAVLRGDAVLEAEAGFKLASEQILLAGGGQLLTATGPVKLEQAGRFSGRAGALEFDVQADVLKLSATVHFESAPGSGMPMAFDTERLEYDRRGRVLTLPDTFTLMRAGDRMQGGSGELFLAEDERSPRVLSLKGGVAGTLIDRSAEPPGRRIAVQATRLSVRYDEAGGSRPEEATLEGHGRELALVESIGGEAELIQGLASRAWLVRFVDGNPKEAESSDPVHFAEYRRGVEQAVRTSRSDSGRIEFAPNGTVERVALVGRVELTDPEFKGWGDRALFDVATGRAEILGPQARLETARGDLAAPHLVYERQSGLLTGTGGVRARLEDEPGRALSGLGWSGDDPIRIEAREATFTDKPRGFAFRDGVRAWKGKNLLLAAQLRGDEQEQRLSAAGKVKTVWIPEPASDRSAAETPPAPIEVTSETLSYDESARRLVYSGDVRLRQEGRDLRCAELVAELGAERRIERMIGTGKVELRDPTAGRTVEGARLEYVVATSAVTFAGDPVVLQDEDGTLVKGRRLRYDLKSGAAQLVGEGT